MVGYSRMKTMISATRIKKTETAEVELYYKAVWKTSDPEFNMCYVSINYRKLFIPDPDLPAQINSIARS